MRNETLRFLSAASAPPPRRRHPLAPRSRPPETLPRGDLGCALTPDGGNDGGTLRINSNCWRRVRASATSNERVKVVPELPEMQALAERLDAALASRRLEAVAVLGFSGLKTVVPGPDDLVGRRLEGSTGGASTCASTSRAP